MSKVLVIEPERIWYDELKIISYYSEGDLESRILLHAVQAFNGYLVVPFKLNIAYNSASAKPDLAFIRDDYSDWIVVEVELGNHSESDIQKQVDVFLNGKYEAKKISAYFKSKNDSLDQNRLEQLIKSKQNPTVMVIVDEPNANWITNFRKKKIPVCIFQVYKNTNGTELFRINGDYPYIYSAECHVSFPFRKTIPDILKIHDPALLIENHDDEVSLSFMNKVMKGKVIVQANGDKLIKVLNLVISPDKSLVLGRDITNKYILRLN